MKTKHTPGRPDYIAYADGGSRGNPGESAFGFLIYDSNKKLLAKHGEKIGINTNNAAEYSGVIAALRWIKENKTVETPLIEFYLDSQLAAMQLMGYWKIKNENLRSLFFTAKDLEKKIGGRISYTAVRRELNLEADRLVNLALDS